MMPSLFSAFRKTTVYALVGESGTGKSFRARLVAQKYGIKEIIDDGLLISGDRILAGHSAKTEQNFMAAVKAALFDDKAHRDEIAKKLQSEKLNCKGAFKILLLGTSEKMVNKIAARLQIPEPSKIIHIEDIATQDEIEKAIRTRRIEGKHVIPVPSIEVKRNYPGIFFDAVRIFKRKAGAKALGPTPKVVEKSVVRPEYSKRGKIMISESALSQMVLHCIAEFDPSIRVTKITVKEDNAGYRLVLTIDVPVGTQLSGKIHELQSYIIDNIERFTGILIEEVNMIIDKLIEEGKKEQ
jgi:uncharacterized alkaline shock family protein YloU/adenylate kinase family enzyme